MVVNKAFEKAGAVVSGIAHVAHIVLFVFVLAIVGPIFLLLRAIYRRIPTQIERKALGEIAKKRGLPEKAVEYHQLNSAAESIFDFGEAVVAGPSAWLAVARTGIVSMESIHRLPEHLRDILRDYCRDLDRDIPGIGFEENFFPEVSR